MQGRNWISVFTVTLLAGLLLTGSVAAADKPPREPVAKSADQRFWDMGDGTVLDTETRLMWMKRDFWQTQRGWVNWYTAMEFVQRMNNKNFAGYEDWRMPTPEEAKTLYNRRKRNTDKDGDKIFIDPIFPNGAGWGTWTSQERGGKAIVVSYKDRGGEDYQDKINGPDAFLRPVRGPLP
ncbi:conserved exported hypothetical protein, contains DUF1566 [Nitrospina gracilis 3/211]|uniref:Lcl C-terminal domain-containing protein n=1 Tax=Nitrospina gracilis (strain 3/211) TaxID=1266370 RepID=M1YJB1_NITG3|nr:MULTISPECIES: DUF1566 domain-containing protein [Nitrospina]MCF8723530.1 hypothetical protein [Nitrospina sp. Nb-3]CCQ90601.1 conserved exported hypothetical protein, contains DUF1566 [Nitrospina gracilis 3/211]